MRSGRKFTGAVLGVVTIGALLAGSAIVGVQHIHAQQTATDPGPGKPGPGGPMGRGGRGGPGGPGGPGGFGPMLFNRLDLSDTQQARVKEILDSHRDEQRAAQQKAMAAHDALETVLISSPLDESTIRAKAAEAAAIDADLAVARGRINNELLQVLTTEQQAKLQQLQASMKQRREQMQERRPGGRPQK